MTYDRIEEIQNCVADNNCNAICKFQKYIFLGASLVHFESDYGLMWIGLPEMPNTDLIIGNAWLETDAICHVTEYENMQVFW